MINFKQYLIEQSEKEDYSEYIEEYFKQLDSGDIENDDIESGEYTREEVASQLYDNIVDAKTDFESWENNLDLNLQYTIDIIDFNYDLVIEKYIEENGIGDLEYINGNLDSDFIYSIIQDRMDSYQNYSIFHQHGYVFEDGSSLDIGGDDHRIIDIEKWYPENIITIRYSDGAFDARLTDKMTGAQANFIEDFLSEHKVKVFHYDVYGNSGIRCHGKVEPEDEEFWDIRSLKYCRKRNMTY
jgi:hypothetical protein